MANTIAAPVSCELIVRKSRFIAGVHPVADREQAQAIVAALRASHPTATHVCWALLAGGQSAAVDDGEPSGTAGRPMLEVMRHHDLDGVLATAVRYFGGIKLGAGGLIRAYADCAASALRLARITPLVPLDTMACSVPYALEGLLRREIAAADARLLDVTHGHEVDFVFSMARDDAAALIARLNEAAQGRIIWHQPASPGPCSLSSSQS